MYLSSSHQRTLQIRSYVLKFRGMYFQARVKYICTFKIRLIPQSHFALQVPQDVTQQFSVFVQRNARRCRGKSIDCKKEGGGGENIESGELGQDNERLMYGKSYVVKPTLRFLTVCVR